jgi:hypothetical protein
VRKAFAVTTIRNHRVVRINDRDDSRADRDLAGFQSAGIAASVVAFVVVKGVETGFVQAWKQAQNRPAVFRMLVHQRPLFVGEFAFFFQDGVRDADFSDVVEKSGDFQLMQVDFLNA